MKKRIIIVSVIEIIMVFLFAAAGIVLFALRGFTYEVALKFMVCATGVIWAISSENNILMNFIRKAHSCKKASIYVVALKTLNFLSCFLTINCGFFLLSIWAVISISIRTLLLLSFESLLVHYLLIFIVSLGVCEKSNVINYNDCINTGVEGIILDSCDIDTEEDKWPLFLNKCNKTYKQEKVEITNISEGKYGK